MTLTNADKVRLSVGTALTVVHTFTILGKEEQRTRHFTVAAKRRVKGDLRLRLNNEEGRGCAEDVDFEQPRCVWSLTDKE